MKLDSILKKFDVDVVTGYFINRIKADETMVGKIAKFLGFLSIAFSVIEYYMNGTVVVAGLNLHSVLAGFGLASVIFGYTSQSKRFRKTVFFADDMIPVQLDFFLREIKQKLKADGAFVCKYHNGDSFGTFPSMRFTLIRSVDSKGIYTKPDDFYNQPMTLYSQAYKRLRHQGVAFLTTEDADSDLRHVLEEQGTKALFLVPIYKPLSDDHHGMVGIRFVHEVPKLNHDDVEWLTQKVKSATGIMPLITVIKLQ